MKKILSIVFCCFLATSLFAQPLPRVTPRGGGSPLGPNGNGGNLNATNFPGAFGNVLISLGDGTFYFGSVFATATNAIASFKGLGTNTTFYMTTSDGARFLSPYWTNSPADPTRKALVTSNGTYIIQLRTSNDSSGLAVSKLYIGGDNMSDGRLRWDDIQLLVPSFHTSDAQADYTGFTVNHDEFWAWSWRENRYMILDQNGGQTISVITNDYPMTTMSVMDTNLISKYRGKEVILETPARTVWQSNLVINLNNGTANAVPKFAGSSGVIIQDSGVTITSGNVVSMPAGLNVVGNFTNGSIAYLKNILMTGGQTASRALVLDSGTNVVVATGTPDGTKFLRDDNTYAVPPGGAGSPGGYSTSPQANIGGAFVGMTNWVWLADGTGLLTATNNGLAPIFRIAGVGVGGIGMNSKGLIQYTNGSELQFGVAGNSNWVINTSGYWVPTANNTYDVGTAANQIRTNWNKTLITSNMIGQFRAFINSGTNLVVDGNNGSYYSNALTGISGGVTNIVFTNMLDGGAMYVKVYITNGITANIWANEGLVPTTWFEDGNNTLVTNNWNTIKAIRFGTYTNFQIVAPSLALATVAGITLNTNFNVVPQVVTISNAVVALTNVISLTLSNATIKPLVGGVAAAAGMTNTSGTIMGLEAGTGITLTGNGSNYVVASTSTGSTNMVAAAIGNLTITNQIIPIAQNFNGSNGVTAVALTNNWDMALNYFKPVTNYVGTNLTFNLSNIVAGAYVRSEFIGLNGTSNLLAFTAPAGTIIRWKNWDTNSDVVKGGIYIKGNYSYNVDVFADRATNVSINVGFDDPFIPLNILNANISNLYVTNFSVINLNASNIITTNLTVRAGGSSSNVTVDGVLYSQTFPIANAGVAATNLFSTTLAANTLGTVNSRVEWFGSGAMAALTAGTNQIQVIYGSQTILDTGLQTASNGWYQVSGTISSSGLTAGATNQYCKAKLDWWGTGVTGIPYITTNVNIWLTQTNSIDTTFKLVTTSRRNGGITNELFYIDWKAAAR